MSQSTASKRSSGDVIIGVGVLTIVAALLILAKIVTTNSSVGQSESNTLFAVAASVYESLAEWIGALLLTTILTSVALIVIGSGFVYAGVILKRAEAQVTDGESRGAGAELDGVAMQDVLLRSDTGIDMFNSDSHYAGAGVVFGLVIALFTNATIPGLLFWTIFFGVVSWVAFTSSGKELLGDVQEKFTQDE
jgi:hypothetical protein